MKRLTFIILIFTFSLFANDLSYKRIYITYTLEKKYIEPIYKILQDMDIEMYIDKQKDKFIIYSKKYINDDPELEADLKTLKEKFKNAKIILNEEEVKEKKALNKIDEKHFKVNLSLGSSNIKNTPNYNFSQKHILNYEAELTYLFNESTSLSFAYLNSSQNLIKIDNIFTGVNYTVHPNQNFYILFGFEVGYSILEFDNDQNARQSSSTLIGVKSKIGYSVTNDIDVFVQYNGIYFEHIVYVESSAMNIKFNYINNISIGLGVKF